MWAVRLRRNRLRAMDATDRATAQLDDIIARACRLVRDDRAVRAVTVVPGRRLGPEEIARLRDLALARDVWLTEDDAGVVRLRRDETARCRSGAGRGRQPTAWEPAS